MTNKIAYNMQRVLMDFDRELLAEGAEWYLSDGPEIKTVTGYGDEALHTVRNTILLQTRKKEELEEEKNMICCYTRQDRPAPHATTILAELCIDEKRGEFVRSWCSCQDFQRDQFSCLHVAGLAFYYLTSHNENLEGSEIEALLKKNTGVDNPLRPGRLRRTSLTLQPFMSQFVLTSVSAGKPAWQSGEKKAAPEKLSMDIYASPINGTLAIELRIGTKRPYQIKNLEIFLNAYTTNAAYSFSNSLTLPAGRENFDESSRELLDYLCQIKDSRKRNGDSNISGYEDVYDDYYYRHSFSPSYFTTDLSNAQQLRLILLKNQELDHFMEIMDGKTLYFSDNTVKNLPCRISLDTEPAPFQVDRTEFGATLLRQEETLIACGFERMYLRQKEEILSLPVENWEIRGQLTEAFSNGTQLYIQEADLPAVASTLYQMAGEKQQQALSQLAPLMTATEKPLIQLYLDYPQKDMISCRMKASYPSGGKSYDLFSQQEDKDLRNLPYEQAIGEKVWPYFDVWNEEAGELIAQCEDDRLYRFLVETIPSLSEFGEVLISDRLKKLKAVTNPTIQVGLQVDAGSLLMSLHSADISKEEIIEVLCSYNPKKRYTRLKNGSFITYDDNTDSSVLEALAESFRAYGKKNPEAMKLPLFRALYMDELLKDRDGISLEEGSTYQELLQQLKNEDAWDYPVPESLQKVLRPYQADGYRWMRMLKSNGFGGILADDMGLGKTLQVLAFLLGEKESDEISDRKDPTLIIAPASLVYNWQKEIHNFTPALSCRVLAGTAKERKAILAGLRHAASAPPESESKSASADIYITSYDLLKRDIHEYEGIHFEHQIIDEAQFIKNPGTQASKAVRLIDSSFRMALTGTPIENRLSELWSIFDYIMPGFLYSYSRFRDDYESPVINNHDQEVMERLRRMVHPFILRRLKKDVLQDLPDKLEESVSILLEGEQRKVYDAYAERLRRYLDKQSDAEYRQSKLEILAELTKLRQICCGPELFLENYKGKNAKLEACIELVHRAIDGGHKLLLFSQFTRVLDELGKKLTEEKIRYYRIDGSTSKQDRMNLVDAFQNESDSTPVFCISLKAGGTGLNLTAADIVIHYDPWWNLAAQDQATDRTHRIGQENTVTVYSLIAEDTIEEQITLLQKTKAQLAEDILSGEGISSIMIHKDDLLALL